jgi:hypothetical protein
MMHAAPISPPLPPPSPLTFEGGIRHPDLWLWDSWTLEDAGALHLYCLALSRTGADGLPITPPQRNDHAFHIRHFISADGGARWRDLGPAMTPGGAGDGADARNVWSGSVLRLHDGRYAFGYTGLRAGGPGRRFLQTICIGFGATPDRMDTPPAHALSCPLRDHRAIREAGYYLPEAGNLGADAGEEGGPILAWRDPFLLMTPDGVLHAYWSAKIAPTRPAIAHARLRLQADGFAIASLSAPITLPDAHEYTQAEVPKLYPDGSGGWLLLISSCDRLYEGQPDSAVRQQQRLYRGPSPLGPWTPAQGSGAVLSGLDFQFGASLTGVGPHGRSIDVLGPFTENGGPQRQLTFPPVRRLTLDPARAATLQTQPATQP